MKTTKKLISLLLAAVMIFGMMPGMVSAAGTEDCVYLSVSFDGTYIDDQYGKHVLFEDMIAICFRNVLRF